MAKSRSCLFRLLVFLLFLALPVLLAPLIPLAPLQSKVEARLSALLGRKVSVNSMRLSFWGGPYFTIRGMSAKEDTAFGEGDFLKADEVRADFSIKQFLFQRQIVIDRLTINSPDFTFVKNNNGQWSWTTIGQPLSDSSAASVANPLESARPLHASLLGGLDADLSKASFNQIAIENASVRFIDRSNAESPESLYRNIALNAWINRAADDSPGSSRVTGEVLAESEAADGADEFKAQIPFDITIDRSDASVLSVNGSLGPGPFHTKNFNTEAFGASGQITANRAPGSNSALNGSGRITSNTVFIPGINLSQEVAKSLQIQQIGNMDTGTNIGEIETDFQVADNVINTKNLRIQELDGLGDATADQGWFKVESALEVNYNAFVLLSNDATASVKTSSPLIGFAVTLFEKESRVQIPINITGNMRNPQIQVDVRRLF